MKAEQKTRDFTLRLIQILVWFVILWAIVFFVALVFQWSGLTAQLAETFFASGFCIILVLAALAVLNITSNLNLISKTLVRQTAEQEVVESKPSSFVRTLIVAALLVGLFTLALGYIEVNLYRTKTSEAISKIESIAETKLVYEAIHMLKTDGKVEDLARVRDILSESIQSGANLSLIFPTKVESGLVYYELTAWWSIYSGDKISEAGLPRFIPRRTENKRWEKLIAGTLNSFAVPIGDDVRVFHKIKTEEGELILLLDSSRYD